MIATPISLTAQPPASACVSNPLQAALDHESAEPARVQQMEVVDGQPDGHDHHYQHQDEEAMRLRGGGCCDLTHRLFCPITSSIALSSTMITSATAHDQPSTAHRPSNPLQIALNHDPAAEDSQNGARTEGAGTGDAEHGRIDCGCVKCWCTIS
ncbi:hypothetical protein JCM8097_005995 [Rhodosporidiobolus ruineniae]